MKYSAVEYIVLTIIILIILAGLALIYIGINTENNIYTCCPECGHVFVIEENNEKNI